MPNDHAPPPLTLFELRRYRAQPGRRNALIALFEAQFRPSYEASGATILASWTVPDEPDHWVWIRAFTDAAARRRALDSFYGGEAWARWGPACRATLADSRGARLLRAQQVFGLAYPLAREALPTGLQRSWSAAVLPRSATPPPLPGTDRTLVLVSARDRVLLQRFDTPADRALHQEAVRALRWPSGTQHWALAPTPCSRLR